MSTTKELKSLVSVMKEAGINYWVESGTLLALIRDGAPFKNDDFDIGVMDQEIDKVTRFASSLCKKEYEVRVFYYNSRPYKFKVYSRSSQHIIDIQIYYKCNGYYISPQKVAKMSISRFNLIYRYYYILQKPKNSVAYDICKALSRVYSNSGMSNKNQMEFDIKRNRFLSSFYDCYTWRVKAKYVDSLMEYQGISIISNYTDYLTEKYGDWQTPNKHWNYIKDDKCLVHSDLFGSLF